MGFDMNQNRLAVPVWSYAFDLAEPQRVIELGSYNGGFTMALAFAGWTEGITLYSWDLMEAPKEEWRDLAKFLGVHFVRGDIWEPGHFNWIAKLIALPGKTFVLCDGGDKTREVKEFSKFLKPGDVIAAHDIMSEYWLSTVEFFPDKIKEELAPLELWLPDLFKIAGWVAYRKPLTSVV
jgi:hypothetical protein